MTIDPLAERIAAAFDGCFASSHRTVVRLGGHEPLYRPPTPARLGEIVCNRDYPASVLHEIAHWCLASAVRRRLVDYGYWYRPPPRTHDEQRAFLAAEEKNQALEAVFAAAAGIHFEVSIDDFETPRDVRVEFARRVRTRAQALACGRLAARAERFRDALVAEFAGG
jgi:hypothetical protein